MRQGRRPQRSTGLARHACACWAGRARRPAVLERLNSAILDLGDRSRFLTLLYGELWPQEDESAATKIVCACASLRSSACARTARVQPEPNPSPSWASLEDLELYEQMVILDPGDVLLCVTDGVTDAARAPACWATTAWPTS